MTTGDEPQIGGVPSDDAPMIGGRGTKIIVSARGAYAARDRRRLVRIMNVEQRLMHKQTVIRQGLDAFRMYIAGEVEQGKLHLDDFVHSLEYWLDDPTQENLVQLIQHRHRLSRVSSLELGLAYLIKAAADNTQTGEYCSDVIFAFRDKHILFRQNRFVSYRKVADWHAVANWHIEAAWTIINSKPVPLFEDQVDSE